MHWEVVLDNLPLLLSGLWTTVVYVSASLALGLILAVPLSVMRASDNRLLSWPVWGFTYFFRGTPLLVQIYLIYYGLGQFEAVRESFLWPVLREASWCALLGFTLNTAAYVTEILRGAIQATAYGEVEAATACGMSRAQTYRRIILPGAFRRALPAYGNEVIFMLHGSVVAGVITILDIYGAAKKINALTYTYFESMMAAAVLYMLLVFLITRLFKRLEHRWHAHLRPRTE